MSKVLLSKTAKKTPSDRFSDFFLHASKSEKIKVFKEVAKKASADQRRVFKKAKMTLRPSS